MKLGRESLILVGIPALFLGAMYVLLFCAERAHDVKAPRFDLARDARSVAHRTSEGMPHILAKPANSSEHDGVATGSLPKENRKGIETEPFRRRETSRDAAAKVEQSADESRVSSKSRRREPLQGRVVGEDGAPIQSARITVTEQPNLTSGPDQRLIGGEPREYVVAVSEDGSFQIDRAPGMTYELVVQAQEMAPQTVHAVGFDRYLEILLRAPGTVSGRVLDQVDGRAVSGALVALVISNAKNRFAITSAAGDFQFSGVAPGPVVVEASRAGYAARRRRLGVLAAGGTLTREIRLVPGLVQRGYVTAGEDGPPIPGIKVQIRDLATEIVVFSEATDQEGFFKATTLRADRGYAIRLIDPSGIFGASAQIIQTAAEFPFENVYLDMQLSATARIEGVDAIQPMPLIGVEVYFSATVNGVQVVAEGGITNSEGFVEFEGLDPRSVISCLGFLPGYAVTTINEQDLESELPAGRFTLVMNGAIPLLGTVSDPEGAPVAGVLVRISPASSTKPGLGDLYTWSDEAGAFGFDGLPPGELMLITLVGGYDSAEIPVILMAGQAPDPINLIIQPLTEN